MKGTCVTHRSLCLFDFHSWINAKKTHQLQRLSLCTWKQKLYKGGAEQNEQFTVMSSHVGLTQVMVTQGHPEEEKQLNVFCDPVDPTGCSPNNSCHCWLSALHFFPFPFLLAYLCTSRLSSPLLSSSWSLGGFVLAPKANEQDVGTF